MPRGSLFVLAPAPLAALLLAACALPADPDVVVEPIHVDSVDVRVMESSPPQASAHVRGVLGDGCASFHSLEQQRSGNTVTVTILRERPRDAVCTQIAKLYEDDIPLQGTFLPGDYLVRVNGVEKAFTTE
jgi:hypothetical protein